MNEILLPVLIVAGIGLLCGLGLAIASIVMAVPKDEKAEAIEEVLPGANCGACGYSGCAGYAKALASGEAQVGLCSPGGAQVANATAALLGVAAGEVEYKTALVLLFVRLYGLGRLRRRVRIRRHQGVQRGRQRRSHPV